MKEYKICYTLENDIKWMKMKAKTNVSKDVILQEVLKKVQRCRYLTIQSDNQTYRVNTSHIRYIRILEENEMTFMHERVL